MLKNNKLFVFIYFLIALLPSVYAQPFRGSGNLGYSLSNIFRTFFAFLGRDYIMLGVTFVLFFMILFAIVLAGTKNIKIFQAEKGVNPQGKAFALAVALIGTIGIFFTIRSNIFETMRRIHEVMGFLSLVMLGFVVFMLVYYGTRQEDKGKPCMALIAAGLSIYLMAWILSNNYNYSGWLNFGFILIVVGIIWCVFNSFGPIKMGGGGSGSSGNGGRRDQDDDDDDRNSREKYVDVTIRLVNSATNNPIPNGYVDLQRRAGYWNPKSYVGGRFQYGPSDGNGEIKFRTHKGRNRRIRAWATGFRRRDRMRYNIYPGMGVIEIRLDPDGTTVNGRIEINPKPLQIAVGGNVGTFIVRIFDNSGNPVPNRNFNLNRRNVNGSNGLNVTAGPYRTDGTGQMQIQVTSPNNIGEEDFRVTDVTLTDTARASYVNGTPPPQGSRIEIRPNPLNLALNITGNFVVRVFDANNFIVPNQIFNLTPTHINGATFANITPPPPYDTGATGVFQIQITAPNAVGSDEFTVRAGPLTDTAIANYGNNGPVGNNIIRGRIIDGTATRNNNVQTTSTGTQLNDVNNQSIIPLNPQPNPNDVRLFLMHPNQQPTNSNLTPTINNNGTFEFTNVPNGSYFVRVIYNGNNYDNIRTRPYNRSLCTDNHPTGAYINLNPPLGSPPGTFVTVTGIVVDVNTSGGGGTHTVRGRIINGIATTADAATTGINLNNLSTPNVYGTYCNPNDVTLIPTTVGPSISAHNVSPYGAFEFRNIADGTYILQVNYNGTNYQHNTNRTYNRTNGADTIRNLNPIQVAGGDYENVAIDIDTTGYTIVTGRVIDGTITFSRGVPIDRNGNHLNDVTTNVEGLNVGAANIHLINVVTSMSYNMPLYNSDGTFLFNNVPNGDYIVRVSYGGNNYDHNDATRVYNRTRGGDTNATNNPIELRGSNYVGVIVDGNPPEPDPPEPGPEPEPVPPDPEPPPPPDDPPDPDPQPVVKDWHPKINSVSENELKGIIVRDNNG